MGYFPLCMDISGKTVLLVGDGPQTRDKAEKLRPFDPRLVRRDTLSVEDLTPPPAFVVAGDLPLTEAERVSRLCQENRIPVNVVDLPGLSTFSFSSMITAGELTVSVSTGGKNPVAASLLRRRLERCIPDRTEEILLWLSALRQELRQTLPKETYPAVLQQIALSAFEKNRPLTREELERITP